MDTTRPIHVIDVFPEMRAGGIALLRRLSTEEWSLPTACDGWTVHDVALHIAGGLLANVARRRDKHPGNFETFTPRRTEPGESDPFIRTLNAWNEMWVLAARRISPALTIELIDSAGDQLEAYFRTVDLNAIGDPVGWAGPDPAPVWLDVAREYTESWTHFAQIREATGRGVVDEPRLFAPVLETFLQAVPHALRKIQRPPGTTLRIVINGDVGGIWNATRTHEGWALLSGGAVLPAAAVELDGVVAWRLATKGMGPVDARRQILIEGDREPGAAFLNLVAILA